MSSLGSRRAWLLAWAVGGLALNVGLSGCGGSSSSKIGGGQDGGSDAPSTSSEAGEGEGEGGGDATMTQPDGGQPSGDDSGDSTTGSGEDSGETGTTAADAADSASLTDTSSDSPAATPESGTTTPDASDSGTGTDGSDAAPSCGATNSACSNNGTNGLCEATVCSPCTDPTDDVNCSAAYGGGSGYLCLAGVCSPGNCRTDTDCAAAAPLCGVTTANLCGKCTTDSQCSGNTAGAFCNTTTGACGAGTCTGTGANPPAACPFNGADICCTTVCQAGAPAGATSCCPGAAGDTYCSTQLKTAATCSSGTCSTCAAGSGTAYTVDPVNGSDTAGNGNIANGNPASCAFRTITRALQVIGNGAAFGITVTVVGPTAVPNTAAETFPIAIPQNVSVTTSGGAITINVPTGGTGFVLNAPSASLAGGAGAALTISGQGNKAAFGIVASSASSTNTSISNLTVSGFGTAGILVQNAGVLFIDEGVTSTANPDGLHVTNTGKVAILVPSGAATHFDTNTVHGVLVSDNAQIALTGVVTSAAVPPTGTITTSHNTAAGIWIEQTAGSTAQNTITGLVSYANAGNGLRFVGGSNVKLRSSVSLGNVASGVIVSAGPGGAATNSIANIDLGDPALTPAGTYGQNTLQAPLGSGENGNSGICLAMRANAGTLLAAGNSYSATTCATVAGVVTANAKGCGNVAACTGNVCDIGYSGAGNDVNVSLCTHP